MTNRSGKLVATLDAYIEELINDPDYEFRPDGTIWTLICRTGKRSVSNVWRQAGSLRKEGYIEVAYKGKSLKAHRIIYRRFNGLLSKDLVINHKNGVRNDNRPENLELTTQSENNTHRFRELKHPPVKGNKKINEDIANSIRQDHNDGMVYRELIKKYRLAKSTISYVINRKTWA